MCMRWLLPPCNPENKEKNMQDFIPVIGFIGAYLVARMLGHGDIAMYVATAVLMIVTVLQIAWMLARKQTVEKRHWLLFINTFRYTFRAWLIGLMQTCL